jgi:NAD(P)H-hydrate epimerase
MARQAAIERLGEVIVVPVAGELKGNAALHLDVVRRLGLTTLPWDTQRERAETAIRDAEVIFDGVAGTGISGGLRPPLSDIIEAANAATAYTVAVDVPSGLSDDFRVGNTILQADLTLTMGLPKRCLYLPHARPACGRIRRIALGFPPALTEADTIPGELLTPGDAAALVPAPAREAYKHRRGVCAVFAGARGTSGAAALSATAAARSTAGMVRIFADADVYPVLAAQCRSVMVAERAAGTGGRGGGSEPDPLPDLDGHSSLLVGPGWGRGEHRERDLAALVAHRIPGVLDADGLNTLSDLQDRGAAPPSLGGRWVLTPHAGELARLTGQTAKDVLSDAFATTLDAAKRLDAVVCLKSHVTLIASPDGRYAVVDGMNPAMGTGGAGDVLAGIIAGIIARGISPFDAARAGCIIHDGLGKRLFAEQGYFLAEDLLEGLSAEMVRYLG